MTPPLNADEDEDEDAEDDEEADDAAGGPGVFLTAPLEGEEEGDDGGEKGDGTGVVEFGELFAPGEGGFGAALWRFEEKDDDGDGNGAEWEVDVETPAPGDVVGEDTAKERGGYTGDT